MVRHIYFRSLNNMELSFENPLFGIALTLISYFFVIKLRKNWNYNILNPVLGSVIIIISFLLIGDINFESYNKGGKILTYFLGPSVVGMGVFLYEKYSEIKNKIKLFLLCVTVGGAFGILSMILLLLLLNTPSILIESLSAKSVTTPIAIEITKLVGGIPEITTGMVIMVGALGNVLGVQFLTGLGIYSEGAIGTALGTTSHGIGTARAFEYSKSAGVYSGLAMCFNGIITAFLTPYFLELFM